MRHYYRYIKNFKTNVTVSPGKRILCQYGGIYLIDNPSDELFRKTNKVYIEDINAVKRQLLTAINEGTVSTFADAKKICPKISESNFNHYLTTEE